ncbi:hypothetical protein P691DRAFT_663836 [Macrolepiota fuliginosa MF-IS2]|uniref:F-box domain-containing protein n=1 Tax=Macrolepiota fuliginosa MF-IS2 TaxID=1400762 RepID=A0A9P5XHS9_9AGAR|nr:hypothetical protein P691DRAFT_663836 [Macrolepiota fuliginosa MF-IS2]
MQSSPLIHLPAEILDAILSLIDAHDDILSFALAGRACASLAIPRHTEYRILRIRHLRPELWAHLAQRADLASFVAHVHISDSSVRLQPDRIPHTLIGPPGHQETRSPETEAVRVQNISKAIANMSSLRTFIWEFHEKPPHKPTLFASHEDSILRALSQKKTLEHFALIGPFGSHAQPFTLDPEGQRYPLWRFRNLRYLTLLGDSWLKPAITPHVLRLLINMPLIEHLEIPLEFSYLHLLLFPALRDLKLLLLTGASASLDVTRSQFIERHTTLERLCWFPLALPSLSSEALPDLKHLTTTRQVIECLASVSPPPPTPSSLSFAIFQPLPPITEDPREANTRLPSPSGCVRRPIESLDVRSLDARALVDLHRHFMDSTTLRKLKLHTFRDVIDVCQVGDAFYGITWLWLPNVHLPSGSAHPKTVELCDLYKIISHFPRLEVLRGQAMWEAVNYNNDKMHLAIMHLAQMLPNLRELDHSGFDERRKAYRRVILKREITLERVVKDSSDGDGGEEEPESWESETEYEEVAIMHITYAIAKPKPRSVALLLNTHICLTDNPGMSGTSSTANSTRLPTIPTTFHAFLVS